MIGTQNLYMKEFKANVRDIFAQLYASTNFSDVTIVLDDHTKLTAHKFVLSAGSSLFKHILSDIGTSPYLYLSGITKEEIEFVLKIIYFGETSIDRNKIECFFGVARNFDVQNLLVSTDQRNTNIGNEEVYNFDSDDEYNAWMEIILKDNVQSEEDFQNDEKSYYDEIIEKDNVPTHYEFI